ncbi:MAG TPA: hypothetical protein VNV87_04015 [Acidimicrobiales bacterium]|jgi:hypothetical protein|nr:hypothetical protein [Acidimicrobiales bacterium]
MDEKTRALLWVTIDVREGWEDEVDRWYDEDHIPEKLAIDGFVRAHRYRSVDHPRRFVTLYELSDVGGADVRVPPTEWTTRIKEGWESVERSVWALRDPEDPQ